MGEARAILKPLLCVPQQALIHEGEAFRAGPLMVYSADVLSPSIA